MDAMKAIIIAVITLIIAGLIYGIPVYFLWNWLMPIIFGLKAITFFQAIGISLLAGFLFKSNK